MNYVRRRKKLNVRIYVYIVYIMLCFMYVVMPGGWSIVLAREKENKEKLTCGVTTIVGNVNTSTNCVTINVATAHWPMDTLTCAVTIDWGDGDVTSTNLTGDSTFQHCYDSVTCSTVYNYQVTMDCGGSGCISSNSGQVSFTFDVDINATVPSGCNLDSAILEAVVSSGSAYSPTPPFTYSWDFGDGDTGSGNPVQHAFSPGFWVVTVTVTDADGCQSQAQTYVQISGPPLVILSDTVGTCGWDTVQIDLTAVTTQQPVSYQWSPSAYLSCTTCEDPLAFPPNDTTYYVTVTDANGCSVSDSVRIDIYPMPDLTAQGDTICPGDTTNVNLTLVSGTSPYQWQWQPPDGLSCTGCASPLVYPDTTTTYQITVIDANGCRDTAFATVFVYPKVNVNIQDSFYMCPYDTALIYAFVSGGTPPYVQIWWTPDSFLSCDTCLNTESFPPDTTTYILHVMDSKGCLQSDTTTVVVFPLPVLFLPDTSICMYDTVLLYPGGPYVSYTWTPNYNISCLTCDSVYVWPYDTTVYQVIAMNQYGCVDSVSGQINPVPLPVPMLPDSISICQGQRRLVYAGIANSYEWSPQYGISCVICDSVYVFPEYNALYIVTLRNEIGCVVYDSMIVFVVPKPQAKVYSQQAICLGDSAVLHAEGGWHFHWFPKNMVSEAHYTNEIPVNITHSVTVKPSTTTTFYVAVTTDSNLCSWDTASVIVFVDSGAIVRAFRDTVVLLNDTAYIQGIVKTPAWYIGGKHYTEVFARWWQSQENAPVEYWEPLQDSTPVLLTDTGKWWFYYFVQTTNGCITYDSVLIQVIYVPCSDSVIFHPLAFTPNNDGVNDMLRLYSRRPAFVKLWRIYDRWGNMLYEARNFWVAWDKMTIEGWDGTYKGKPLRPDVYVYYLFVDCDGTVYFEKGDVTLLR